MHQFMRLLRASRHFRAVTMTAVALTVTMGSAYAGTTADSVSWSNLSAGDDWSARVLDSLFPMSGAQRQPQAQCCSIFRLMRC